MAVVLKYAGMPILPHAIKKIRGDARKAEMNKKTRTSYRKAVKSMRTEPNKENLTAAFSSLDRAAKKKLIHGRYADRIKSRLSKLIAKSETTKKVVKKAAKKKTVKTK